MIALLIILGLLVFVIVWFVLTYNGFVRKKANAEEGWSTIDVYLKKRNDLIPNLVETVKGYASHEATVLQNVTQARNSQAGTVKEQSEIESQVRNAMMNLYAVAENYPELKANSNFISLQQDLNSLEDDIEMARRYYNGVAKDNNVALELFPSRIVASMFNFKKFDFFEVSDPKEREAVKVAF
ncbi:LemA family protein [Apibacter raozihei]|uniref:LemA family protein n=1 Tax=Apibacter raozihei TaxID=2500547 RepID=UPI000FE43475|nr:LemA family protein [Apibacter raozihei]